MGHQYDYAKHNGSCAHGSATRTRSGIACSTATYLLTP